MTLANDFLKKEVSISNLALGSSIITNISCLFHIRYQNTLIDELIKKNNSLVDSINKIENKISMMHSNTMPFVINNSDHSLYIKPLLYIGVISACLGVSYYLSTAVLTKMSTLTIPKIVQLSAIIGKLPFFVQPTVSTIFLPELSTTLWVKSLGDEIKSIYFRHKDEESYTLITDAIKLFIESKKDELVEDPLTDNTAEIMLNSPGVETIVETAASLAGLF